MKLGLLLTNGSPSENVAVAQRAEAAGLNSVWCVDFHGSNALVQCAAIAAATESIEIGTGIANTFTRSPLVLGTGILDIEQLSGGRFRPGLGTGLQRMNEEWYGMTFGKPVTDAKELFALLRKLFETTGPGFAWEGNRWQLKIPAYFRPQGPREDIPLLLAGVNRRMISTAGAIADGLIGHPVHSRRWHREVSQPLLQEAALAQGRDPDSCPIYPHIIVAINEDIDAARRDARCQMGFSYSVEHYHSILELHGLKSVGVACRKLLATYDFKAMADAVPDELVDEVAIACTPDEFSQRLQQWQDITPEPMLFPASIAVPEDRRQATLNHLFTEAQSLTAT